MTTIHASTTTINVEVREEFAIKFGYSPDRFTNITNVTFDTYEQAVGRGMELLAKHDELSGFNVEKRYIRVEPETMNLVSRDFISDCEAQYPPQVRR